MKNVYDKDDPSELETVTVSPVAAPIAWKGPENLVLLTVNLGVTIAEPVTVKAPGDVNV
jgi:hypothetical protein